MKVTPRFCVIRISHNRWLKARVRGYFTSMGCDGLCALVASVSAKKAYASGAVKCPERPNRIGMLKAVGTDDGLTPARAMSVPAT
jgi:hypothetical protein